MRTLLIISNIVLSLLLFLSCWIKFEPLPRDTMLIVREDHIQRQLPQAEEIKEVPAIITEINRRNAAITSFVCERVSVKTWKRGLRIRLSATALYEKDNNFRLRFSSVFGSEMDLGSNDEIFWYWSRRDMNPGLYWAVYADYHKTRLKTPFNPIFMRDTLGLSEISTENARISETSEYVILVYDRYNAMNQPILYSVVLDKATRLMAGILVTDTDGVPLVTADIQHYPDGVLKKILYTWHEENRMLILEFRSPQINVEIPSTNWIPPNKIPQINMAEE